MPKTKEIIDLVTKLNNYRKSYYEGNSEIPDEKFDFEEERLREMDPNNEYFKQIGSKNITRDINVEHKVPMLSMQKVQKAPDAINWYFDIIKKPGLHFTSINPGVWIDPKLDGISGKIVYDKEGNYSYASTRGDGKIGAKILFGDKLDGVPKHFLSNSELRGEFIINKKYRKIFNGPLRNCCSGILKRKEFTSETQYVSFVMYDVHTYSKSNEIEFKDRQDKLNKIKSLLLSYGNEGFHIVPVEKTIDINKMYDKYVKHLRDEWEYETDGIIMTIDGGQDNYDIVNSNYKITTCNRYNMALKPPALYASSTVKDIKVFVNRTRLSFVADIEPVTIGDITCSAATLHNYTDMQEKHIGIGTKVLVCRANDVIPKIIEAYNEEGTDIKYVSLTKCPICGASLLKYNRDLVCVNENCQGVFESKLSFFLEGFGVKNIGPSTIHELVSLFKRDNIPFRFSTFINIVLNNSIDKYLDEIFGEGTGRFNIFKASIQTLFDKANELTLIGYFNIPTIGVTELAKHGIKTVKDILDYSSKLNNISVLSSSFDSILYKWINSEDHKSDLVECYNLLKPYFKESVDKPVNGISYCISGEIPGYTKAEIIDNLKKLNPTLYFVSSVTSSTDYLISIETGTTKVLKAEKYNIPIVSLDEMIKKFK